MPYALKLEKEEKEKKKKKKKNKKKKKEEEGGGGLANIKKRFDQHGLDTVCEASFL
jgi:lipoate synthase